MIDDVWILTIGDFETLRSLEERWSTGDYALSPVLRGKLDGARIVFQADLPRDVATLGSRIAYTIDGGPLQIHKLTALACIGSQWLPVSQPVGLALLGAREGHSADVAVAAGSMRRVQLHRVVDQPEAQWPGRFEPKMEQTDESLRQLARNARQRPASLKHGAPPRRR